MVEAKEAQKEKRPQVNFSSKETEDGRLMSVLSYISIMVLVPVIFGRDSRFVKFHANQGLVLLIVEAAFVVIYNILSGILLGGVGWKAGIPLMIIGIVLILTCVVASVAGMIWACRGEGKCLPVIGKWSLLK